MKDNPRAWPEASPRHNQLMSAAPGVLMPMIYPNCLKAAWDVQVGRGNRKNSPGRDRHLHPRPFRGWALADIAQRRQKNRTGLFAGS